MQINPFEIALGIQAPWKITDTELIPSEKNPNVHNSLIVSFVINGISTQL